MKGFNIAPGGALAPVDEFLASLHHEHGGAHGAHHASLSALLGGRLRASQSSLSDAPAPAAPRRPKPPHKRRWGTIIEAARAARVSRLIGRSRSEDSVCDHARASPRYVRRPANASAHPPAPAPAPHAHRAPSRSASDRSESASDERRSPERGPLHPLTALAALKRKRKKFSDSRRSDSRRSADAPAEALQRASSVPARPTPAPAPPPRAPRTASSEAADGGANRGGSREPLLASLDDDAHKVSPTAGAPRVGSASASTCACGAAPAEACGRCAARARLAGVTPLHGHAPHHSAGWL